MSASMMTKDDARLQRTEDCVFIQTSFHLGLGKMRQVRGLKVETDTKASHLRHQKQLIDSPELEEIRSQDGKLKRYLESKTCRYSESMGFLPRVFLNEVDKVIVAYQTIRRPALVAKFMEKYRELEALDFAPLREALAENFNRADYPHSSEVEAGFSMHFMYKPVGDLKGLEGISDVIIAREAEKERKLREAAVIEWRDTLRLTGAGIVDTLLNVLKPEDGKRKRLCEATVEKMQDFLDTFSTRDLFNDTEFQKQVITMRQIMKGVDVEKLRHSDTLKGYVANSLEVVRHDMASLVVASGRKFR